MLSVVKEVHLAIYSNGPSNRNVIVAGGLEREASNPRRMKAVLDPSCCTVRGRDGHHVLVHLMNI